ARTPLHPLPGVDPVHCTAQLGEPGPWNERLPHFRLDFTPSNGAELQSEYLVPRARAQEAFGAMRDLGPRVTPLLQVGEIRTVAPDPAPLWLSPFDGPAVGIHLTWKPLADDVARVLRDVESALLPLGARPHWGKLSHALVHDPGSVAGLYPRFDDFGELVQRYDPQGRFLGGYGERLLAGWAARPRSARWTTPVSLTVGPEASGPAPPRHARARGHAPRRTVATTGTAGTGPTTQKPREEWTGQVGFIIAAIGSAVGLGNIWRFRGVAYENGGGAFLVPYLVALLTAGIPILFLD